MTKVLVLLMSVGPLALSAPQDQSRQMSAIQKATLPGAQHARLNNLAGEWTVEVTFKAGPGPEQHGTASSEARWILGGRFLEQSYKNGSGLEVRQFLGYDNRNEKFFEIKMDNMETGLLHTEGTMSEDGRVITNYGERTDPISGKKSNCEQ